MYIKLLLINSEKDVQYFIVLADIFGQVRRTLHKYKHVNTGKINKISKKKS